MATVSETRQREKITDRDEIVKIISRYSGFSINERGNILGPDNRTIGQVKGMGENTSRVNITYSLDLKSIYYGSLLRRICEERDMMYIESRRTGTVRDFDSIAEKVKELARRLGR